ncbi:O-antigen translocase [Flavobacterium sp.]|uniref:O-antigen translocase n=1 Tax=Flavobacterium sp. TaxID=239 RepID=UPI001209CC30|nr:O-antigen translocase [Flavobacterium sp.]RZJ69418.1 MAG: O-antigen translocase [Flavobacterium sp.]
MGVPKKIVQSGLLRATSLNGLSVLVKIAIGFATSKVIAVFLGSSGMALIGNLRNFLTSLEGVSTLGLQNGIVKYVAESKSSQSDLKRVVSTVFLTLICVVIVCSAALFVFADFWGRWIFESEQSYAQVFRIFALALPFYAFSIVLIAILNGLGDYKKVIWANILGNILGLAISIWCIVGYELLGALVAIVLSPSLLFFVSLAYLKKEVKILSLLSVSAFDLSLLKKLGSFSLMALFSAVVVPLVYLQIRQETIVVYGKDAAGQWEAMTRISSYYMLFVSTLVSVYFLPKLVLARDNRSVKTIFLDYFKTVMPLFFVGTIVLYLLRDLIVILLFTDDFLQVEKLFFFQLLGDVFRSASMILGCLFIARKMTKAFFFTEILSLAVLYLTSHFLLSDYGISGLVAAHAITYAIYFVVLIGYFRKVFTSSDAS